MIELKSEVRPVIMIPNEEKAESWILAATSPSAKMVQSSPDRFRSSETITLKELSEKLENEQRIITKLKN